MPKPRPPEEESDLDLVPIMNLVLILIPLLLLSVVFLEITVINVTMPQKSIGSAATDGDPPKRLQVMVSKEGFWIIHDPTLKPEPPATPGCEKMTVCLKDKTADPPTVESYDWVTLYNELMKLKSDPSWADHETVEIVAGSDIPFGTLVKTMDVTRFQRVAAGGGGGLEGDASKGEANFDANSTDGFNSSEVVFVDAKDEETGEVGKRPLGLFPLVVLGVPSAQ